MYQLLKQFHSYIAYFLLAILLFTIITSLYSWLSKKSYTKSSKTIALLGLTATHLQIMLGLVLYFISPLGFTNFSGEAMKNAISRLFLVEHPLMMLLAVLIVTIGYVRSKNAISDSKKFKNIAIFYTLSLVFILSRIPWDMWF